MNNENLKPFKKNDPRINRKGRPKSFDKLRALAQQIAHEPAIDEDGKPIVQNNKIVTQIEAMMRQMIADPKDRRLFLEYAFGKPKEEVDLNVNPLKIQGLNTAIEKIWGEDDD